MRPNGISALSVVYAAGAGTCLALSGRGSLAGCLLFVGAAAFLQLRLLCNLMDGMVAVEGGFRSKSGEVWNDVPDRISDPLILVPAGYAITVHPWGIELGWAAGLLAVLTAYARMLGGALGLKQDFGGIMAKPQRMAVMTVACIAAAAGAFRGWDGWVITTALSLIVLGALVTFIGRVRRIAVELEAA